MSAQATGAGAYRGEEATAALRAVMTCPLCADTRTDARAAPDANLYSEQLALLLGCDEGALLAAVHNVRCVSCGLWYKARWFAPATLRALFGARVPDHPRGWDIVSGRFSAAGFAAAIDDLARALDAGVAPDLARCRRALASIIDSLQGIDDVGAGAGGSARAGLRARLVQAVAESDVATLSALRPVLAARFDDPAPFKRFSGFASPLLWDWLVSHIGPVRAYGEVGCPLWGQLLRPMPSEVRRVYFNRDEANYWSSGCRRDGCHCTATLGDVHGVEVQPWPSAAGAALDAMAAFQYLDHLERPDVFVTEVFTKAPALLLVFDDAAAPSAIQHATGWGAQPIAWLARRHGKRVIDGFAAMTGSGNRAWLLCDV